MTPVKIANMYLFLIGKILVGLILILLCLCICCITNFFGLINFCSYWVKQARKLRTYRSNEQRKTKGKQAREIILMEDLENESIEKKRLRGLFWQGHQNFLKKRGYYIIIIWYTEIQSNFSNINIFQNLFS